MSQPVSPFKFLDSYRQEDDDVYFGREQETDDLYDALSGVKHLLVYGPSGAGKTSLVECGLRNQFSDVDWFALTIRRGHNMNASVFSEINAALEEKIKIDPVTHLPIDQKMSFGEAIENLFAERFQPVYLLFDQFEELLISGDEEEKKVFFKWLHQLIRFKVPCRVMLIMREEFVGHLSKYEHLCPGIFQHRFRLEKMRKEHVGDVIRKTLEADKYQAFFKVEDVEKLTLSVLSKLPDQQNEIELAHVQVFLGELWDRASEKNISRQLPLLHSALVQDSDDLESILESFLKKQIGEIDEIYGDNITLELLTSMISDRHTKLQLSQEEMEADLLEKELKLKSPLFDLLDELINRRILRTLKSGNQTQYEISHDLLALVVGQNVTEEMKLREKAKDIYTLYLERQGYFSLEELDYLRPFQAYKPFPLDLKNRVSSSEAHWKAEDERKLRVANEVADREAQLRSEAEDEREKAVEAKDDAEKNERRAKQRTSLAVVLALVAAGIAIWAYSLKNEAQRLTQQTEKDKIKIESNLEALRVKEEELQDALTIAKEARDTAKQKQIEAELARNDAQQQANFARLAEIKANDARDSAQTNLERFIQANADKKLAEEQKELAQKKVQQETELRTAIFEAAVANWESSNNYTLKEGEWKTKVDALVFYNKNLTTLPDELFECQSLKELDLSGNQLIHLKEEIGSLKGLAKLNLSRNPISRLPDSMQQLDSLTILNLSESKLVSLPPQVRFLTALKELNLSNNQLSNLPDGFADLESLTRLDISENRFSSLPEAIFTLDSLKELYVHTNEVSELSENIENLTQLHALDLSENGLDNLPDQIGKLEQLRFLALKSNSIKRIPGSLGDLKKLKLLDLRDNQLKTLPDQKVYIENLEHLKLCGNDDFDISTLQSILLATPKEIRLATGECNYGNSYYNDNRKGKTLEIRVSQIGSVLGQLTGFNKVNELKIDEEGLESLANHISIMKDLRVLDLTNIEEFQTSSFWDSLANTSKSIIIDKNNGGSTLYNEKEILYVEIAPKASLPDQVWQLKNITQMHLRENQILEIPKEVKNLKRLVELDLRDNVLSTLPMELVKLDALTRLDLYGNENLSLPNLCAVFSKFPNDIGLFIRDYKNNRFRPDYRGGLAIQIEFKKSLLDSISSLNNIKRLSELEISSLNLTDFPVGIEQLMTLKILDLSYNELEELPQSIGNLKALTRLELDNNQLKYLPQAIGELKKLEWLNVVDNRLDSIPVEIGDLRKLYSLNLSYNNLTMLPEEIGNLKKLDYLRLRNNKLKDLPPQIGKLKDLDKLDLSENEFIRLSSNIWELKSLDEIDLSGNENLDFSNLFTDIAEHSRKIHISTNRDSYDWGYDSSIRYSSQKILIDKPSTFPDHFWTMKNITILNLSNSDLENLSPKISGLENLVVLDLKDNKLSKLPLEIAQLKQNLRELYLSGNPISPNEQEKIQKLLPDCKVTF